MDKEENSGIKDALKITGFPTVLLFTVDKRYPLNLRDHNVETDANKIVEFINVEMLKVKSPFSFLTFKGVEGEKSHH